MSPEVNAYISVFVLSLNDQSLRASVAIMLTIGFFLTAVAAFNIFCVVRSKFPVVYKMLNGVLLLLMLLAFIAGFIPVGIEYDMHRHVKGGMREQLKVKYKADSAIGKEWNRMQVKKRCCGVDGSWDYEGTNWFNSANPDPDNPKDYVPDSCCSLNFNQDRELTWVDPQQLQLRDRRRCQEDAVGKVANSVNIHIRGCFTALFSSNPDLWHDQSIWTILHVTMGLCLTIAIYQVIMITVNLNFYDIGIKEYGR